MIETWIDIKDYEGTYQVSSLGNVKSLDRIIVCSIKDVEYKRRVKGKILKPCNNGLGYLQVCLKNNIKKYIHVLVAEAFVKKPDNCEYYEVNHKDHNKANNNYSNLEWVSKKENHQKRVKFYGIKKYKCIDCSVEISCSKAKRCLKCSRLKSRIVKNRPSIEVLNALLKDNSYVKVGKMFGVSDNTIRKWLK